MRTAGIEPATNGFGIHYSTSELSPLFTSFNLGFEPNKIIQDNSLTYLYCCYETIIMHQPGIEPGSLDWKSSILPLNYRCLCTRGELNPGITVGNGVFYH